jgi:mannose-6-phosphate isomerase-like protein (cupin superfamily)
MNNVIDPREAEKARTSSTKYVDFYSEALKASEEFRKEYDGRMNVVKSADMPMERSPDGLIKWIINEKMDTKECCLDIYMQFLPPGRASGKHRHLSEEVFFVIEGSGYDLHWDVKFDCHDKMEFEWDAEPKKFEWKRGDFIYVPPFVTHHHFADSDARLIVISNRIFKEIGFDWFDQLEDAPRD